jgi:hypothetical protein
MLLKKKSVIIILYNYINSYYDRLYFSNMDLKFMVLNQLLIQIETYLK